MKADRHTAPARGLNRTEAAAYLGIGTDVFDRGIAAGLLPQPRLLFSKRIWDMHDLDRALDELPRRGEDEPSLPTKDLQTSEREQWMASVSGTAK